MRTVWSRLVLLGLVVVALTAAAVRAEERSAIAEKYTWNLADMYPSTAAWTAAKESVAKRIPALASFQGHLGDSAAGLYEALATLMEVDEALTRLQVYAMQIHDQDQRDSSTLEMQQAADQLGVKLHAAASYYRPEILAAGETKILAFVAAEPRLQPYRPFLDDILRRKVHTLGPAEEKIAAQAGDMADAGEAVHSIFTNADLPYPTVTLSDGKKVRLDAAAYTRYRALPTRADRDTVFKAFWGEYQNFQRTLGTSLYAQVKAHIFNKDVHKFASSMEASLFSNNIPTSVYTQLIADVHANLPTLHRYLKLRQKMMGVDQLRYEDLYAPIIKKVDMSFTPEQGMDEVLAGVAPLGKDYVEVLRKGFQSRWVDFLPSTGKRSGAYSNSAYGVHPYQLQNFMNRYDDVSTLAHESGHSMHSYLADKTQPYVTHDYSIFVAEVASTLNENLLLHYELDRARDDATRLFLLGSYLDGLRQTLFRQTLFAEFEMKCHDMAEHGETLTSDNLSKLYLGLLRDYYGDAQNICKVDSLYRVEWAYIPHFYYNFYVYQYATSLVASTSIANAIRDQAAQKPPVVAARDAYIRMLSSGSCKYPIDLLKGAGVDMTTSQPFDSAMKEMNRVMGDMEAILARGKPAKE